MLFNEYANETKSVLNVVQSDITLNTQKQFRCIRLFAR